MILTSRTSYLGRIWRVCILLIMIAPAILSAQAVFTFGVANLEAYERSGNWAYDADNAGCMPFFFQDGDHFTFNAASPHYYSEKKVHAGTTPGMETVITCTAADPALAPNPALLKLYFKNLDNSSSDFELVSFRRVNTTDPLDDWSAAGEAGDVRVYSNAKGQLEYDGMPKLYLKNTTFVITTPYPNQASMRLIPGMGGWNGNIGNGGMLGLPQTGYGFGELDTDLSDAAWLAPFAASNYKVDLVMVGITSLSNTTTAWFNFVLEITPAALPENSANTEVDITLLSPINPVTIPFVDQNANVRLTEADEGGEVSDLSTFYINEIRQTPAGTFPPDIPQKAPKYWQIGSTLDTFKADIRFNSLLKDGSKGPEDWTVVTRVIGTDTWQKIPDFVAMGYDPLDASMVFVPWNGSYWEVKDVQRALEFSLAAEDIPLPVTLSSFTANVNAQNLIALAWSTASETSLRGFKVYYNTSSSESNSICLTPEAITALNSSSGASYSYTASLITQPGDYYFWLEALSIDGTSEFFGPINKTLGTIEAPPLPLRNTLSNAYPNPFRTGSSSRFEVELKAGETGEIAIYNVVGQVVKSIRVSEGYHTLDWDGRDSKGNHCASGIYFYKLSSPSLSQTKKLVIVR